jgi:hypothetical protein
MVNYRGKSEIEALRYGDTFADYKKAYKNWRDNQTKRWKRRYNPNSLRENRWIPVRGSVLGTKILIGKNNRRTTRYYKPNWISYQPFTLKAVNVYKGTRLVTKPKTIYGALGKKWYKASVWKGH